MSEMVWEMSRADDATIAAILDTMSFTSGVGADKRGDGAWCGIIFK